MAVQYDSKNNAWGGFIIDAYKAKKGIVEVSEEATKLFDKYKDKDLSNAMNQIMSHGTFDNFIEKNKLADETLISFLQDTEYSEKTLENYQLYLKKPTNSMTLFQRASKAASSAAKSFVAALSSMAITWAITEGISLLIKGVSKLNEKFNETIQLNKEIEKLNKSYDKNKQSIEDINTSLDDNLKRIKELQSLDNITYADEEEIKKLKQANNELKNQKKFIEEIQAKNGQDYIKKIAEKDYNDFKTNVSKYDKDAEMRTYDWATGGVTTIGRMAYRKIFNDDTDYLKLNSAIEKYEKLLKLKDEGVTEVETKVKAGLFGTSTETQNQDIDKVMDKSLETIQKRYEKVSAIIDDVKEKYPDLMDTKEMQEYLQEQLSLYKYIDYDSWADTTVTNLLRSGYFDGIGEEVKAKIENGFNFNDIYNDLENSDVGERLVRSIANNLYDNSSDESLKKAASYLVNLLRDETSQAAESLGEYSLTDIFQLKDANNESTELGKLSDQLDNIQSAYASLMDTIDQYNETGYITVDQYQAILSNGSQFLDYLIDEDGNLKTDTESMKELTKARLLAMEAQMQQGLIDNVTGINTEADAMTYLSSTNYELAESYNAVSEAALEAWKVQALNNGISQDTIDKVLNKRKSDSKKISDLTQKTILGVDTNPDATLKTSNSNSSSSKSNSKDSIDIIDFAEEKLNHLNTLIDDTQKHIEQLEGSANKNALTDSLIDINKSKMNTLEQVSDLYTRMANEYLAKIPEQYKGLAKEGGLEIDKFIGDGNSEVTDAIKDYQTWADKVDDINSQLIELKQTLKDLEVDKFNNIKDDFDSMYGILDKNKSKIKDVISLLETQEQNVGQGFYEELITETKSQIQILKEERDTLTSQMTSALRNGIEYGSNEWKDMYDALQDVDSSIISCENDLKDFQKSINELHWNTLEKIKDQFSSISSELDSLNSLLEKDTVTSNGKFTSESITRIGLLAQKYELARNEVAQYNKEIKYLENLYKNGKISINEYTDKLNELRDSQFSSISTAEEAKKAILDLAEARVNEAIDAIDEETDAYEELINKQKDSLQAEKDLYEYKKNIAQKEKEISALKRKINAMMGSDDASTIAEREKLEAELAEAVNDLEDYKYDHSVEVRSDALDKELEDYKDAQDKRTKALKDSLKNEEEVLNKAINEAKSRANEISNTLLTLERKQGITIASCIIAPWRTGSSAIAGYNQALNSSTSNFTAKLNGIKTNIQSVQTQANNMASTIMSAFNISNNSGVYEAISKVRQNLYNTSVESIHLKQWISSALNSTYGNGAVNSINNVRDAANKAGSSVNGLRYEINQLSKSIPDLTTNMTAFATGAYAASSYKDLLDMIKRNEAKLSAQSGQGNLPSAGINKYLPFPMFAEGGVVNGKSSKLAQAFGEDVTILAKKGERVLSLDQTKSFDKLVENLPEITPKLEDFVKTFKLPQNNFTKVGSSTPIINIDAGITVQGNIDKNFAKEFENMQNQLTKNVTGKIATSLEKLGMQKNNCRPL